MHNTRYTSGGLHVSALVSAAFDSCSPSVSIMLELLGNNNIIDAFVLIMRAYIHCVCSMLNLESYTCFTLHQQISIQL